MPTDVKVSSEVYPVEPTLEVRVDQPERGSGREESRLDEMLVDVEDLAEDAVAEPADSTTNTASGPAATMTAVTTARVVEANDGDTTME